MAVCMTPRMGSQRAGSEQRSTESQFLAGTGELALRISGPGHDEGRLIRIRSPKCTIGSAAGCTLRLRARGVGGLHCWILRGAGGTVIRRMSGRASLNGAHFDEAMLTAGDRLSIGSVEMIIEDCGKAESIEQSQLEATNPSGGEFKDLEARLDQALEQVQRLEGESRQGFESSITAADRADQMRDALAAANEQLGDVCAELAAANEMTERLASELAVARQLIDVQAGELAAERAKTAAIQAIQTSEQGESEAVDTLRAEVAAKAAELTVARETVDQQAAKLAAATKQLTKMRGQLDAANEIAEQQTGELAVARQMIDVQASELAAERARVVAMQTSEQGVAETIERLNNELSTISSERTALENRLREVHEVVAAERADWERERAAATTERVEQSREIDALRAELAAKAAEVAAATQQQAKNETTAAELAGLRRQIAELTAENAAKTLVIEEANEKAEAYKAQLDDQTSLQGRVEGLMSELEVKSRALEQAEREFTAFKSQAATVDSINQQAAELERRQCELCERESQVAEALQAVENKQATLVAEAEQLTTVKQMLAEKEQRLSEAADQIEQAQAAVLSKQEQNGELDQRSDDLVQRAAEIAARMADLDKLFEQLVDERAAMVNRETEIVRREGEFEERWGNLNRQAEQFQALREQLDEREAELAEREVAVTSVAATSLAATSVAVHDSSRQSFDSSHVHVPGAGNLNLTTAVQADHDEIADDLYKTVVRNQEPIARPDEAPGATSMWSREFEQPAEEPNEAVDVTSALGRLADAGVWRQSPVADEPAMAEPAMAELAVTEPEPAVMERGSDFVTVPVAPLLAPRPQAKSGDEEESIESYMERLMQRVRGGDAPAATAPTQTTAKPATVSLSSVAKSTTSASGMENVGSTMVATVIPQVGMEDESAPLEPAPRRPVPDAMTNLAAMRELANSAAHAAINQSVRTKARTGANRKLLGACLTLGASVALAYFAWEAGSTPGMVGAAAGCTIAAYWMLGAAVGFIGLKRSKIGSEE